MLRFASGLVALTLLGASPVRASAQSGLPSDVSFALRRAWLDELMHGGPDGRTVGARWADTFDLGPHSGVHKLSADCELHVAAKLGNRVIAEPRGIVAEPPNVCKRRVPQIEQGGRIDSAWTRFFDQHVTDKRCEVSGFPRIFTEHAEGGQSGSSNPDHVVEVHPALSMTCEGTTLPLESIFGLVPGMKRITDNSTAACLEDRKLYVRKRGSGSGVRYEFLEEGGKGRNGQCGNFAVVDAHLTKGYIRGLENGASGTDSDHVALSQAWVGESGPYPLKLYTYRGTPENKIIADLAANADSTAGVDVLLHGLLTYDYFTIAQVLQKPNADSSYSWIDDASLMDYKEVRHPLAFVVFGIVAEK